MTFRFEDAYVIHYFNLSSRVTNKEILYTNVYRFPLNMRQGSVEALDIIAGISDRKLIVSLELDTVRCY